MVDPMGEAKLRKNTSKESAYTINCTKINLKKGSKGANVTKLQSYLKTRGWYTRQIDGDFGKYTEEGVKKFQTFYKLAVDGIFGPVSCKKLHDILNTKKKQKVVEINKTLTALNNSIAKRHYSPYDENPEAYIILYDSFVELPPDEAIDTGTTEVTTTTTSSSGTTTETATGNGTTSSGDKTITVNMLPSCSRHHGEYYRKTVTFLDYCPFCGHKGVLKNNPKGVYEGEITCGHCDADFCGWDGNDKMNPPRKTLTIVNSDGTVSGGTSTSTSTDSSTSTTTTTVKKTNLNQITLKQVHTQNEKLGEVLISNLMNLSTSDDTSDLSHEASFKVVYTQEKFKHLRRLRTCELLIYRKGKVQYNLQGFINSVKLSQENNLPLIEVSITGYQCFLESSVEFNATAKKSILVQKLCNMVGLRLNLDLNGLKDTNYTIQTSSASSSTSMDSTSSTTSTGTSSDDAAKRAEIFKEAARWTYGGASYSDPEQAYNWTKAHHCGDCFCASASLFYQFKTFTNYGVRIVVGYSPYASSGTHRTIQLKENGQWIDPPEYKQMTRNLRVLTKYSRHTYGNYIRE